MRLFILLLSIACVAAYGYALAGFGGYSFGKGRPDYIMWGLIVGTLCGAAAMKLWKNWMKEAMPDLLIFDIEGLPLAARPADSDTAYLWRDLGLPAVVYAGQSRDETERILSRLGWEDFPRENLIDCGGVSRRSLEEICRSVGAKNPFFFGSTSGDKEAWGAFGRGVFVALGPKLANDPSPVWNSLHFDTLEQALSALLPCARRHVG